MVVKYEEIADGILHSEMNFNSKKTDKMYYIILNTDENLPIIRNICDQEFIILEKQKSLDLAKKVARNKLKELGVEL